MVSPENPEIRCKKDPSKDIQSIISPEPQETGHMLTLLYKK